MATSQATQFALVKQKLDDVSLKLSSLEHSLETKYVQATELALIRIAMAELEKKMVTQDQFWPIKTLIYGAVGLVLTAIVVAIVGLVVRAG